MNASRLPPANFTEFQPQRENLTLLDPAAKLAADRAGYKPANKTVYNDPAFQSHPPAVRLSDPAPSKDPTPFQTNCPSGTASVCVTEFITNAIPDQYDISVAESSTLLMQASDAGGRFWDQVYPSPPRDVDVFSGYDGGWQGDPFVIYDTQSCTWFTSVMIWSGNGELLLAVSVPSLSGGCTITLNSKGVTPLPTFNVFKIPWQPIGNCADNAYLGNSDDKLTITAQDTCTGFQEGEFWVFNKSDLNTATPLSNVSSNFYGPKLEWSGIRPAREQGTTVQYLVTDLGRLVTVTGAVPNTYVTDSFPSGSVSQVDYAPDAPQPGTTFLISTLDVRIQSAIWQSNALWYALDDGCTPIGDSQARSCIRLVEIDTSLSRIVNDFDFAGLATYFFYPALILDHNGILYLAFGHSDSNTFAEFRASAGYPVNGKNSLGTSTLIESGTSSLTSSNCPQFASGNNNACKYGDYFSAAINPDNTGQVWLSGMIVGGSMKSWIALGTYIQPSLSIWPSPVIVQLLLVAVVAVVPIYRRSNRVKRGSR